MACFPKIDQPCPLGIDERERIDGYCARCEKTVHALDALDETQRRALLRQANGSICVSWRRPVARGLGVRLGAALAMSVSASALAIEVLPNDPAANAAQSSVEKPGLFGDKSKGPECDEKAKAEAAQSLSSVTITGGVSDPHAAEWVDDSDLPDLPMVKAAASTNP